MKLKKFMCFDVSNCRLRAVNAVNFVITVPLTTRAVNDC